MTLRKKMTSPFMIATSEPPIASLSRGAINSLYSRSTLMSRKAEGHIPIDESDLKEGFASYEWVSTYLWECSATNSKEQNREG